MRISNEKIREVITKVCERVGYSELSNTKFEWSNRLRTTMGMAYYRSRLTSDGIKYNFHINFSTYVFDNSSVDAQVKNVIHEMCHIIHYHEYFVINGNRGNIREAHGRRWKQLMRMCGVEPEVRHKNPIKKNRTYEALCGCRSHEISGQVLSRMIKRSCPYRCKSCGNSVMPTEDSLSSYLNR